MNKVVRMCIRVRYVYFNLVAQDIPRKHLKASKLQSYVVFG